LFITAKITTAVAAEVKFTSRVTSTRLATIGSHYGLRCRGQGVHQHPYREPDFAGSRTHEKTDLGQTRHRRTVREFQFHE
jgi:hypothetical protein